MRGMLGGLGAWAVARPLVFWAFLVYMALAWWFAEERIFNTDCSYQLFHSVNNGNFFFQEARYGMFITQVPMLIGVHLGLPMKAVTVLYSLGLAGTYAFCCWLAHTVLRSPASALAICMALMIGVGDSFYHATTETHLLLALSGLLHAALNRSWETDVAMWKSRTVVAIITVWCLFTHPNALFTIGFVVVLVLVQRKVQWSLALLPIGLCGLYFLIRFLTLQAGSYDARQYGTLAHFMDNLPRFLELYPIWFISENILGFYLPVAVLCLSVLVLGLFKRMFWLAALCTAGFWLLTILTFPDGTGDAMMVKSFMPGVFMLALPFAELCFVPAWRPWLHAFAALLLVHGAATMYLFSDSYAWRLDHLERIVRHHGPATPKMVIEWADVDRTALHFSEWATSLDVLLLSRCLGDTAKTIYLHRDEDLQNAMVDPQSFLYLPWETHGMVLKNKHYFNLPAVPYRVVHVEVRDR